MTAATIGVFAGDELIYAESFGVADRDTGRAADRDTLYQIGSVSKVFTATLLGALRDRGLVRLDERALAIKFRTPGTMYNLACVYALKGDRDKALGWLERALAAGPENRAMLQTDTDLDNLREDERFQRLLRAGGK